MEHPQRGVKLTWLQLIDEDKRKQSEKGIGEPLVGEHHNNDENDECEKHAVWMTFVAKHDAVAAGNGSAPIACNRRARPDVD